MPAVASESLAKHYVLSTPYILMLPLKPNESPMLSSRYKLAKPIANKLI